MNLAGSTNMEEIPLDDVDPASIEYRVLMAYATRQKSASKYGKLLEEEAQRKEGSSVGKQDVHGKGNEHQDLSPMDEAPSSRKRSQKKKRKRKRSGWKRFLLPSCLRVPAEKDLQKGSERDDAVNSGSCFRSEPPVLPDLKDDSVIGLVVDRLSQITNNSRSKSPDFRILRSVSVEADGGGDNKSGDDDRKDEEEKIINTIVALLRKSGDELQEKVQKDKTFCQLITELMTYPFFSKIATKFSEETPVVSGMETQIVKVACVAEVTARLTAIDNHPMNMVLGFGTKYLKENFSPWINSHGGWEALELSNQEELDYE
uniref:BCL2 like 14 n=1 Tax=Salvator merianae TaxID=96440 RepID=A0A8D0BLU7_SALMN